MGPKCLLCIQHLWMLNEIKHRKHLVPAVKLLVPSTRLMNCNPKVAMPKSVLAPSWAHTSPGGLNKMLSLVQHVSEGVDSVFLTSSEVTPMILLQGPQEDKSGSRLWTWSWPRLLGICGQVTFLSEAYSLVCKIKEMKIKNKTLFFPRTMGLPLNVDTTGLPWCCCCCTPGSGSLGSISSACSLHQVPGSGKL